MSTVLTKGSNGVSYGYRHTITAGDDSDGVILFDFQNNMPLVATIQVYDASGVLVDTSDMVVTYPAVGQVQVEDGAATFALTATDRIDIVAQYARGDV